jgi:hypothetical protein
MLSEKHRQPIFFSGPSQRHDIISVIVDSGIGASKGRECLFSMLNIVEIVVECFVGLF